MEIILLATCYLLHSYISFQIRYAVTDMRKLANRMAFGTPEESSLGRINSYHKLFNMITLCETLNLIPALDHDDDDR